MAGRNGMDELSRDLYTLGLLLLFLGVILKKGLLYAAALVVIWVSILRILSINIIRRQAENMKYTERKRKVLAKLRLSGRHLRERKDHRFYTCPSCGQKVRVPKNRGRIEIRCPKCGNTFIKDTGKREN